MAAAPSDILWFRMIVRGLGIFFISWGLPDLLRQLATFFWYSEFEAFSGTLQDVLARILPVIAAFTQTLIGVYLLTGAPGLIRFCTRGALGMCPACNYDIRHVPGATCPECGVALPGRAPPPGPPASPPAA